MNKSEAVVRMLLKHAKADVSSKDPKRTPLWLAASQGHEAVVQLLLKKGNVNVNSEDDFRYTSLGQKESNWYWAVVQLARSYVSIR